jgi:hypothetical protein
MEPFTAFFLFKEKRSGKDYLLPHLLIVPRHKLSQEDILEPKCVVEEV